MKTGILYFISLSYKGKQLPVKLLMPPHQEIVTYKIVCFKQLIE